MNVKRSVLSTLSAVALVATMLVSSVSAGPSQSAEVTATENGDFGYSMRFGSVNFSGSAPVTTNDGVQLVSSRGEVDYHDDHAFNENGWTLSIKADDFTTDDGFQIDNKYLSIRIRSGQEDLCTNDGNPDLPVEGGNNYQAITTTVPEGTAVGGASLESEVVLLSATTGRGCGTDSIGLRYTLDLPPGTYTGGDSARYTTNIVLTEMSGAGVGDG